MTGDPVAADVPIISSTSVMTIGTAGGLGFGLFTGVIDEVAIYDHVLPPDRIAAHFAASLP